MKINKVFSSWTELIQSVTQGSVKGPWLCNIYTHDLVLTLRNFGLCNSADDTTLYSYNESLEKVSE